MHWTLWIVVGWFIFSAIAMVAHVGKPRGPLTGGSAAFALLMVAAMVALIFIGGNA